jgi:hypothetical protein
MEHQKLWIRWRRITPYETELPNNFFRVEQLASIALAPNDALQQYMEDHESEISREARNEIDEILSSSTRDS